MRALLPSGEWAELLLDRLCVSTTPGHQRLAAIGSHIKQHFREDARYLLIDLQGDGALEKWQVSVTWGQSPDVREYPIIYLNNDEHNADSIIQKIETALGPVFECTEHTYQSL